MEPGLKAVLECHRRNIEVVSQALKTEVSLLVHVKIIKRQQKNLKEEISIDI